MPDSDSPVRDPIEELAEDFFERRRRGESLSVEQFVGEHSEWAERLASLLPMLMQLEDVARDAVPSPAPAGVAAGRRLGQYRLVREIGRGGMGIVFEADDEQLDRRVALKLLPPQASLDQQLLERFEREASAAARLSHPGIVPVYGDGSTRQADGFGSLLVREGSRNGDGIIYPRATGGTLPYTVAPDGTLRMIAVGGVSADGRFAAVAQMTPGIRPRLSFLLRYGP